MKFRTSLAGLSTLPGFLLFHPAAEADGRVRTLAYEPGEVVAVAGREGFQSSILFGGDEKIENVAVGDSLGWQVTPNKRANVLFLKPVAHSAATNMTVVTDKRVYLFDLLPGARGTATLYSLRFAYPAPAPVESPAAATTVAPPPAAPAAPSPPPPDPLEHVATFNFAWKQEGARRLLPAHVFDDGRLVYLDWGSDTPLPAILVAGEDGVEGPVNYTVRGGTIVVDGVAPRFVLRSGKEQATLIRLGAPAPAAATASARDGSRLP